MKCLTFSEVFIVCILSFNFVHSISSVKTFNRTDENISASETFSEKYSILRQSLVYNEQQSKARQISSRLKFSCERDNFFCTSGGCIHQKNVCNGIKDCEDGSDEADTICPNLSRYHSCRSSEYSCKNGECIDIKYKCDGTVHCLDNSDEMWDSCNKNKLSRPLSESSSSIQNNFQDWQKSVRSCQVPIQPQNGIWRLHRSLCNSGRECRLPSSVKTLDVGTFLVYSCNPGFRLIGNREVVCGPSGQLAERPTCQEIRCPRLSTVSTKAVCSRDNIPVSTCELASSPVGTIARLSCKIGFSRQSNSINNSNRASMCRIDGLWSPRPTTCIRIPRRNNANIVENKNIYKISSTLNQLNNLKNTYVQRLPTRGVSLSSVSIEGSGVTNNNYHDDKTAVVFPKSNIDENISTNTENDMRSNGEANIQDNISPNEESKENSNIEPNGENNEESYVENDTNNNNEAYVQDSADDNVDFNMDNDMGNEYGNDY